MNEDKYLPIDFQFQHPNKIHILIVRENLFKQFRLQLCKDDEYNIVREACAYHRHIAVAVKDLILSSDDPEKKLGDFAKPYNCDGPGGRIRLDNKEGRLGRS